MSDVNMECKWYMVENEMCTQPEIHNPTYIYHECPYSYWQNKEKFCRVYEPISSGKDENVSAPSDSDIKPCKCLVSTYPGCYSHCNSKDHLKVLGIKEGEKFPLCTFHDDTQRSIVCKFYEPVEQQRQIDIQTCKTIMSEIESLHRFDDNKLMAEEYLAGHKDALFRVRDTIYTIIKNSLV